MGTSEIPEQEANLEVIKNFSSLGIIIPLVVNRNAPTFIEYQSFKLVFLLFCGPKHSSLPSILIQQFYQFVLTWQSNPYTWPSCHYNDEELFPRGRSKPQILQTLPPSKLWSGTSKSEINFSKGSQKIL